MAKQEDITEKLPTVVAEYIDGVVRKVRYRKKIRAEVRQELTGHFADALRDCKSEDEKQTLAKELITEFGDAKLLARLIRRGKKRCRPLWKKALIAVAQVMGIVFLLTAVRVVYLAVGRCEISVDYVQWMNEQVRAGRDESLNAFPYYQKAAELSREMPDTIAKISDRHSGDLSEEQWEAIEKFLQEDVESFKALQEGAGKPYYWSIYEGKSRAGNILDLSGEITEGLMPRSSAYKKIARKTVFLQVALKLHKGDIEGAVDDWIVLKRFSTHIQGEGLLIEQLVGTAVEAMADWTLLNILTDYDVPADILSRIHNELQRLSIERKSVTTLEMEKALWLDSIQKTFTNDGKGNGRMLIKGLPLAAADVGGAMRGFVFGFPDRREVTENFENYFRQLDEWMSQTPWQLRNQDFEKNLQKFYSRSLLLEIGASAFSKVNLIGWRARTQEEGLTAIIAVLQYKKATGQYPQSLAELVEKGYLKEIPKDPFSGGPLMYKVTDDNFLLYSVGANLKDDGGGMGIRNGVERNFADNGDDTYWPVKKTSSRPKKR